EPSARPGVVGPGREGPEQQGLNEHEVGHMRRSFVAAAGVLAAAALLTACSKATNDAAAGGQPESRAEAPSAPEPGLQVTDLQVGEGPVLQPGQTAVVHYTGWLYSH